MYSDGTLIIELTDHVGTDHYTLRITMNPHISETDNTISVGPITVDTTNRYKETTTTTITKTSDIYWTVSSVEKVTSSVVGAGGGSA